MGDHIGPLVTDHSPLQQLQHSPPVSQPSFLDTRPQGCYDNTPPPHPVVPNTGTFLSGIDYTATNQSYAVPPHTPMLGSFNYSEGNLFGLNGIPNAPILPAVDQTGLCYSPEANLLITDNGSPDTSCIQKAAQCSRQHAHFCLSLHCRNDDSDTRKSRPMRCIETEENTLVVVTPSKSGDKKNLEDKVLSVWTRTQLPACARLRWLVLRKAPREQHRPVTMCPAHNPDGWGDWMRRNVPGLETFQPNYLTDGSQTADPFMITGQASHYQVKQGHYFLVVPVTSLRESKGKDTRTGEEGFVYSGHFFFPCNTNTKDHKSKENCVTMVTMLEGPGITPEIVTFDFRVCACPGRDGDRIEMKDSTTTITTTTTVAIKNERDDNLSKGNRKRAAANGRSRSTSKRPKDPQRRSSRRRTSTISSEADTDDNLDCSPDDEGYTTRLQEEEEEGYTGYTEGDGEGCRPRGRTAVPQLHFDDIGSFGFKPSPPTLACPDSSNCGPLQEEQDPSSLSTLPVLGGYQPPHMETEEREKFQMMIISSINKIRSECCMLESLVKRFSGGAWDAYSLPQQKQF